MFEGYSYSKTMEEEKLKTFKEIINCDCKANHAIQEKELRAEAVKWVKANRKAKRPDDFKHFFNLTEEDLE